MGKRIAVFIYGLICYLIFFATFLYAVGFIGNVIVPKTIDSGRTATFIEALLVNSGLLGLFALQHSIMARRGFKKWLTGIIPKAAERSTYVLLSSLALILLFWQWRPMGVVIWDVQNLYGQIILYSLFALGWIIVLLSTFLINHFDLFGLRQVWLFLRGKEYTALEFKTPFFYRYVRHPLYLGWLFAFWSTPTMTMAHLVFALLTTAYILVAIQLEEKDLIREHGLLYESYKNSVPMIVPVRKRPKVYQQV